MGYDGVFLAKHISTGATWSGGLPDGVAIFWNTKRIKTKGPNDGKVNIGYEDTGSLRKPEAGWSGPHPKKRVNGEKTETYNVYRKKDFTKKPPQLLLERKEPYKLERANQNAIALKLEIKYADGRPGREFLMMTAHLASGNKAKDEATKRDQGRQVARFIQKKNKEIPIIFACDFNNRPGGVTHTEFFNVLRGNTPVTGAYDHFLKKWRCTEETNLPVNERTKADKDMHSPLTIRDAQTDLYQKRRICPKCKKTRALRQGPVFTTDKWRRGGTQVAKKGITRERIDFIFHTKEFRCTGILDITKEKIEKLHMPGWKYPSDHFAIAADLVLPRLGGKATRTESALSKSPRRPSQISTGAHSTSSAQGTVSPRTPDRRRMAQREFSSRRDSPVMVRLLEEIVAAQDN